MFLKFTAKCKPGFVSYNGFEPCYMCPYDTFQPKDGKEFCFICPLNGFTEQKASTFDDQCIGM